MIEETIPLSAVPEAVERMRAGKSLTTKIMVNTELA
jgi:hypothetical protein